MTKRLILPVLFAGLQAGCAASSVPPSMMVVPDQSTRVVSGSRLANAVSVGEVSGGQQSNPLPLPQVSNESLKSAAETALFRAGYAPQAGGVSRYILKIKLEKLEQPWLGADLTVTSTITYELTGAGIAQRFEITEPGTATIGDSIIATDRLRYANQAAIRNNINAMLVKLRDIR